MRTLAILLLGAAVAAALPMEKELNDDVPVDGWFVPQLDGSVKWQSEEEFQMEMHDIMRETKADPVVKFYLYTNSNPTTAHEIITGDAASLSSSPFNNNHPTRFIIHGWQGNYLSEVNIEIRTALLATGEYNVICVDWSSESETLIYPSAVLRVPDVGKKVAAMIDYLSEGGFLSQSNLILIGHSLGAHVSGFAGKSVSGQIHSIIGLDTALPGYHYDKCGKRLCKTDAFYVESIHTDAGGLGFARPIGHGSFLPNGGASQPGCFDILGLCDHNRAIYYYADAILNNNLISVECDDYLQAIFHSCGQTYSTTVRMGADSNAGVANGVFYTPVKSQSPYGYGTV